MSCPRQIQSGNGYYKDDFGLYSLQEFREPLRPKFNELLWACTDRAKSVAMNVKKDKAYFGAQLTGKQVSFSKFFLPFTLLL